jgi:hypothetical protein
MSAVGIRLGFLAIRMPNTAFKKAIPHPAVEIGEGGLGLCPDNSDN